MVFSCFKKQYRTANGTQHWISYSNSKFVSLKSITTGIPELEKNRRFNFCFCFPGVYIPLWKDSLHSSIIIKALDIYPQEMFARLKTYWDIVFLLFYWVMHFIKQINQIRDSKPLILKSGSKMFQVAPKKLLHRKKCMQLIIMIPIVEPLICPLTKLSLIELTRDRFSDHHQWKSLDFTGLWLRSQDLLHWGMLGNKQWEREINIQNSLGFFFFVFFCTKET